MTRAATRPVRDSASDKPSVAIVGSGIAGTSMAWLLDGDFNVSLIENRSHIGGHAHTIQTQLDGATRNVDLGAQFVAPRTHPTYFNLLKAVGIADQMFNNITSLTFMEDYKGEPLFVSPVFWSRLKPLIKGWNSKALGAFAKYSFSARKFDQKDRPRLITLRDFLNTRKISADQKQNIAIPFVSAMNGCDYEDALEFSARAGQAFLARSASPNPFKNIMFSNSHLGLGGNVQKLYEDTTTVDASFDEEIIRIWQMDRKYALLTSKRIVSVDHLIMACPPYISRRLLFGIQNNHEILETLDKFTYFKSQITIHRDPVYMHEDQEYWSLYNCRVMEKRTEASVWYSEMLKTRDPLFKSWTTERSDSNDIVGQRNFLHPKIDPAFVRAQEKLRRFQGRENLWFTGSYCHDVDSQETALRSSIDVCEKLAPEAPNLRRLKHTTFAQPLP